MQVLLWLCIHYTGFVITKCNRWTSVDFLKEKIGKHSTYQNIKLNVLHGLLKMELSVQKTLVEMSQVYLSPNLFHLPPFSGKNIPVSLQIIYLKKVVEWISWNMVAIKVTKNEFNHLNNFWTDNKFSKLHNDLRYFLKLPGLGILLKLQKILCKYKYAQLKQ